MNEPMFQFLKTHLLQNKEIRLLNMYKGVPISYDAKVLEVNNHFVRLQCNRYQIPCIVMERGAYIQSDKNSDVFHGQLYKLDLEKNEAILTNLVHAGPGIGNRDQIRVEPEESIWASLRLKNSLSAVTAKVTDLSVNGLGIYLERHYFHPQLFRPGTELSITLDLPIALKTVTSSLNSNRTESSDFINRFARDQIRGINSSGLGAAGTPSEPSYERIVGTSGGTQIQCNARVIHYRPELYNNRYRIGLRLQINEGGRQIISQFVSHRQADLIREFRVVYEDMIRKLTGNA